jgi:hypothetical protein
MIVIGEQKPPPSPLRIDPPPWSPLYQGDEDER